MLIFFPNQMQGKWRLILQGPKCQGAVPAYIDDPVKAKGVAHAFLHHEGAVKQQVVRARNIQRSILTVQNIGNGFIVQALPGYDQRLIPKARA